MKDFNIESKGEDTYLTYNIGADEQIDTVIVGMMDHNSIPGLLPMSVFQLNQTKSLRYDISSKITLSEMFSNVVRKEAFVKVLLGITSTLMGIEDYMIEQESFIIDMEHVFVNPVNYEVGLICLPIIREDAELRLDEFVKNLVFSAKYDQTENCDYIAKLINFINGQTFTLSGFKKQLEEILGLSAQAPAQNTGSSSAVSITKKANPAEAAPQVTQMDAGANTLMAQAMAAGVQAPVNQQVPSEKTIVDSSQFNQNLIPGNPGAEPKKEKHGLFGKKKEKEPKPAKQKEEKPKRGKEKRDVSSLGLAEGLIIPGQTVVKDSSGKTIGVDKAGEANGAIGIAGQANLSKMPNTSFNQVQTSFGETTVLGVNGGGGFSNETTVLGIDNAAVPNAYLIRRRNNEQVKVTSPLFRIGKEHSSVDYFIGDNTAISRGHANIITKGSDFYIIDTNSKNHTYVNGMMISPNMETLLTNGTNIRLADEEFEFRIM